MINLAYDFQGKIITIYIQIDNYSAQIPYNSASKFIDWDSIDYEPTRLSLKTAWDEWAADKDLTYELRDRPDLAPVQVVEILLPNWSGFISDCDEVAVGGNGLFQKLLGLNFNLAMNIYMLLLRLKDTNNDLETRTLTFLYSQILPLLDGADRADLVIIGQKNNIPIAF